MAAPTENRFVQFNKTKMCKFEVLGRCKKGRECPFAHTSKELKQLPDLRCTKLCKSLILTGICADPVCAYAHSKDELRSTGGFHKTKMCRFMQTGSCALGPKCNFAHSSLELRDTEDIVDESEQEDMQLPPGLGWESDPAYEDSFAETDATENRIPDLSGLAHALDMMLAQPGRVADVVVEPPKATNLAHDSPAYVRLSSAPDAWRFNAATSKPCKASEQLGHLNFDYLNGDEQSQSTRSPPSPPTPPSPSGSGGSSGKMSSPALYSGPGQMNYYDNELMIPDFSVEGFPSRYLQNMPSPWETSTQAVGLDGFGTLGSYGNCQFMIEPPVASGACCAQPHMGA